MVETLFPGSPHEMLSIYHLDEGTLMLTHYCVLQNQPCMRALPMKDKNVIDVEFSDGTNMASTNDSHMHSAVFTVVDKDHYTVKWTNYENGESAHTVVLNMARVSE